MHLCLLLHRTIWVYLHKYYILCVRTRHNYSMRVHKFNLCVLSRIHSNFILMLHSIWTLNFILILICTWCSHRVICTAYNILICRVWKAPSSKLLHTTVSQNQLSAYINTCNFTHLCLNVGRYVCIFLIYHFSTIFRRYIFFVCTHTALSLIHYSMNHIIEQLATKNNFFLLQTHLAKL